MELGCYGGLSGTEASGLRGVGLLREAVGAATWLGRTEVGEGTCAHMWTQCARTSNALSHTHTCTYTHRVHMSSGVFTCMSVFPGTQQGGAGRGGF